MKPRPFYRWKSFWLGLCVLVFLGWAWVRSMTLHDEFTWAGTRHTIFGHQVLGEVQLDVVRGGASDWGSTLDSRSWATYPGRGENLFGETPKGFSKWFPAYSTPIEIDMGGGYSGRGLVVAHWFIILLFLVPWASFLSWRWWKQRKLTETNA